MSKLTRILMRLYPRPWRERYGAEFEMLLGDVRPKARDSANILAGAAREHARIFLYRPWWHIAGFFVALGAMMGGGAILFIPTLYEASSTVRVTDRREDVYDLFRYAFSDDSLRHIATSRGLYRGRGMADAKIIERMRNDIRVWTWRRSPRELDAVAIGFMGESDVALSVTRDLVAAMDGRARELNLPFTVVDRPSLSEGPIYPNKSAVVLTGALAGLLLGCIVSALARLRHGPALPRAV